MAVAQHSTTVPAIVECFLDAGGRLMIDPQGRYSSFIDLGHALDTPSFRGAATRFAAIEKPSKRPIRRIVTRRGELTENGWLVLRRAA